MNENSVAKYQKRNYDVIKKESKTSKESIERHEEYIKKYEKMYFKDCQKCKQKTSMRLLDEDKDRYMCLKCNEIMSFLKPDQKRKNEKEYHTKIEPIISESRSEKLQRKTRLSKDEIQRKKEIKKQVGQKTRLSRQDEELRKEYVSKYKYDKTTIEKKYDPTKNNNRIDSIENDLIDMIEKNKKEIFKDSF